MGIKLGDISPLAGMMSGEGLFGGLASPSVRREALGLKDDKDDKDKVAMSSQGGKAKGGKVKKMAKGGSASSRADGCCSKGKTKGRMR